MEELKQKRNLEPDIVKGFGILLITVYHLVYRKQDGFMDLGIRSLGWLFIAVFFCYSGYFYRPGKRNIPQNYKARFKGLFLFTVVTEIFLLIVGGIYCILVHGYTVADVWHDAVVTFLRPEFSTMISSEWGEGGILFFNISPVWFIWSMCWTEFIFFPLAKLIINHKPLRFVAAILILVAIQIPIYLYVEPVSWSLTIVPIFVCFMLIGAKLREIDFFERMKKIPALPMALITVGCFAAHFGLFLISRKELYYVSIVGSHGAWDIPIVLLQLLIGITALFGMARGIEKIPPLAKGLSWVGRHTLVILLWHCFYGMVFADMMNTYVKPGPYWYLPDLDWTVILKSMAGFVLTVISCILTVKAGELLRNLAAHLFHKEKTE